VTKGELTQQTTGEQAPVERERYLAALVEIQTLLLSEKVNEKTYQAVLKILGQAASASRVYIFTNQRDEEGRWFTDQQTEWVAQGIPAQIENPKLQNLSYDDVIPRWFTVLSRGMYITSISDTLPVEEKAFLDSLGVKSILVLPIFVGGNFFGFIGFDNCLEPRPWTQSEITFLQIAAAGISFAQQRQWNEEALRRSQSSLLLIMDQLPAILWTTNLGLQVISMRGSDRVGLSTDQLLSQFFTLFHTRTEKLDMLEMHRQALTGQQVAFEMLREDRVFQARLEPFYNSAGAVVGVLGLALDITDSKRIEADLRKSEVALRSLNAITLELGLNFMQKIQALLVMGTQHFELETGILVAVNGDQLETVEIYSTNPALDVQQLKLEDSYARDVLQTDGSIAFERAAGTKWQEHPFYQETKFEAFLGTAIRVAGKLYGTLSYFGLQPRKRPFASAETEFLNLMAQWIGVELEREQYLKQLRDNADEIARNSVALAEARDQALEASRLKSEFLATMSHEIRTPMNALIGMTELLQDTPLGRDQHEFVDVIRNSAQDLMALINDILDLSKIEAGKLSLETLEFEPTPVIEQTAEMFAARACQKKIGFMVYVSPSIPIAIRGDPVRLRQVLSNLISNAIKFTDQGEVLVRVEPWQQDINSISLHVEVQDSGIGLSEVARRRLFQPFTQADASTTRKYGGTGLGLAISKRLVDLMDGEIGVDSMEGLGSTFWFNVPFQRVATLGNRIRTGPLFNLAGSRVLIADSYPTHREILKQYCSYWGMRCIEADSVESAVSQLKAASQSGDPFIVALMDLDLAGLSELSFARELAAVPDLRRTNLILLTPYDQRKRGEAAVKAGFTTFLTKPVKKAQLFETIGEVINRSWEVSQAETIYPGLQEFSMADHYSETNPGGPVIPGIILLAEDNPANQKLTLAQLRKLGYGIELASDGKQAVEDVLHHAGRYSLVLMDTQMPEIDGLEATRIIRQAEVLSGDHIPIVALTASEVQEDLEACLSAGMDVALSKPITLEQLRITIEKWKKNIDPVVAPLEPYEQPDLAYPLDRGILDEIRSLQVPGEPDLLTELIDAYLTNSKLLVHKVEDALDAGNAVDVSKLIHSLKGTSGNLGAYKLANLCGEVEALADRHDLSSIALWLPQIESEYQRVVVALAVERNFKGIA
jgi:signal transduction histidine kinase/DNA-binding response OmpR family regulator/HPt (histidine-containing phosphotransfer) domain-containing protein/PAS domain-containing protein